MMKDICPHLLFAFTILCKLALSTLANWLDEGGNSCSNAIAVTSPPPTDTVGTFA